MVKVGKSAPDFELEAYHNGEMKKIKLSEYREKWVVLFFWPLDFTFVCPTEIKGFNQMYDEFKKLNAEIFGCSVDSVHSHKAWQEKDLGEIKYPMLSDFNKEVSRAYNILEENKGIALRGTFIIDPEGILRWSVVSDLNVGRSTKETLRALQALQTGELCPIEWQPGENTLGKPR